MPTTHHAEAFAELERADAMPRCARRPVPRETPSVSVHTHVSTNHYRQIVARFSRCWRMIYHVCRDRQRYADMPRTLARYCFSLVVISSAIADAHDAAIDAHAANTREMTPYRYPLLIAMLYAIIF